MNQQEEKQVYCMGEPVEIKDADPVEWTATIEWKDGKTTETNLSGLKADGGIQTIADKVEEVTDMTWEEFNQKHLDSEN